ncbi:Na+/H+ antiporter subunit E [Thiohalocapsa sp. ML1]|jgi:multicomponent K+:H+ antiporter subunit E|uniref:Na+/H+ antiporter subunit E n=1 Tax=Thiohalocapsa sp. ML1 TaxID=1431688 RepID=UPI000731F4A4|nr:Na+/H+ antiporter subunit E [Thiohalocapsa sp. ML1]
MLRRLLPHPLLTLVLTLTWLLLVNSFTIGQALLGLLLGLVIPAFTRHFWPDPVRIARPWWLVFFLLKVLWDILVANVAVAALILGGRRFVQPAFVSVPLDLRTELAISILANTVSLTPGTVSAWLSPDRRTLVVHGLRVTDAAALVHEIKTRYERPLIDIFESTC